MYFLLIAALLSILVIGCDSGEQASSEARDKPITTLRLGHTFSPSSSQLESIKAFTETVATTTRGSVVVSLSPEGARIQEESLLELTRQGKFDLALVSTASLSRIVPAMQLLDLPFLFPDYGTVDRVLDGQVGRALIQQIQLQGLEGVAFFEDGFKFLTANKPLRAASDFENLTIAVTRSSILQDQMAALSAKAVVIDRSKALQALQDGAADAQEYSFEDIVLRGTLDAQSHVINSRHGYLSHVLAISHDAKRRLPSGMYKVLVDAARQAATVQRKTARDREAKLLATLGNSETQLVQLTDRERSDLRKRTWSVLEKHRLSIGTALVEMALQEATKTDVYGDDQIVVGIDADMAGNSALSGLAIRRGAELAVADLNARGGLLGKRLVLTVRDNSMVPARGLANLKHFAEIPQLVAVLGGISSPVALAELDFIHEQKILYLDPWAAATPIVANRHSPNFVFRVSVRDEFAAGFLVPEAISVSKKVALLLVNNGWGRSNHVAMVRELGNLDLVPTTVQWFDWGEEDPRPKIQEIYASGAEVIVYVGNGVEAAKFLGLLSKRSKPLPVVSHWGITGGEFHKLAQKPLQTVDLRVLQTFAFIGNERPQALELLFKYKKAYGVTETRAIPAVVGTAHAYDLVHMLGRAIEAAGSVDRQKIRNQLERIEQHVGVVKTYAPPFSAERHDALDQSSFFLARYQGSSLYPLQ